MCICIIIIIVIIIIITIIIIIIIIMICMYVCMYIYIYIYTHVNIFPASRGTPFPRPDFASFWPTPGHLMSPVACLRRDVVPGRPRPTVSEIDALEIGSASRRRLTGPLLCFRRSTSGWTTLSFPTLPLRLAPVRRCVLVLLRTTGLERTHTRYTSMILESNCAISATHAISCCVHRSIDQCIRTPK